MKYSNDGRIVATLDAGGTNLVFAAIRGNREIVEPLRHKSNAHDLNLCIKTLKNGFREVIEKLESKPVAISFAFPGPADYERGIIGDLPNFPSFRGGVPLGPILNEEFQLPVYINNDGSLFAYGEALAGALPQINEELKDSGSSKQYKHLFGITFGTGFGGGAVINNELLIGDNSCGGDIWCLRNKKYSDCIVEESVCINAVKRVYNELTGVNNNLEPKDIYDIAEGRTNGDRGAAIRSFEELGEMAGDAIAHAVTVIDGIVVIGGGLSGASKYIFPALVNEMNSELKRLNGEVFRRMQVKTYNLNDKRQREDFLKGKEKKLVIPGSSKTVKYDPEKRIGITSSVLGSSKAISLGAYAYALNKIDCIH